MTLLIARHGCVPYACVKETRSGRRARSSPLIVPSADWHLIVVGRCIMKPETEPWWRQAQADLETAVVLLQTGRFYATSWFVQQAVEKGLKVLSIEQHGVLAPRTRDLRYLGHEVSVPAAVDVDLGIVDPAFDITRYPDPHNSVAPVDDVTEADATRDFEAARRIFAWLDRELHPPSTRS